MASKELIDLFESSAADLGQARQLIGQLLGVLSKQETKLAALRDLVFDDELLENGPGAPTVYSQRDPKWAGVKLGTSASTIGGYGCLITAVASMLTDAGTVMNPEQLNTWLNANGGYSDGNMFVFNSVGKLNTVRFYNLIDCPTKPAPLVQLDELVNQRDFVIVKVDNGKPPDYHWVRYIGAGQCIDPWYGDIAQITPRYRGKDAAESIRRVAIYKRVTPKG